MNQIMNIFRKDVRHLRLELLGCLAILPLFAVTVIRSWTEPYSESTRPAAGLSMMLALVVHLAWAFLILRLVHGERLAGVNQFWTTRPYEWGKLLAAKTIFLLLFVYLPLLLMQLYLLYAAGIGVASNLPGLLLNSIRLTVIFVLPIACIAAVTISFAQSMLALLGIAVGITAFVTGLQYAGSMSATLGVPRYPPMFLPWLEFAIAVAFALLALLLQYRRRVTRRSVAVLAIGVTLLVVTSLTLEGSPAAAVGYPAVPTGPQASMSIRSDGPLTVKLLPKNPRTAVYVIPLKFSYSALDAVFFTEAKRFTVTASDGYSWTSNWTNDAAMMLPDGAATNQNPRAFIDSPWPVHDRFMGGPVTIRMEFLIDQTQSGVPFTTKVSRENQSVPGLGSCALDQDWRLVVCLYASGRSDTNFNVSAQASMQPCPGSPDASIEPETPPTPGALPERTPVSGSIGGFGVGMRVPVMTTFLSPVNSQPLNLWHPNHRGRFYVCPGQPITFTPSSITRRFQLETQTATIVLKDTAR